jgi:hypothetical protein
MEPPSVAVKDGMCGWRLARSFSRSTAVERLVNAMLVVIMSELVQLSLQVYAIEPIRWTRSSAHRLS